MSDPSTGSVPDNITTATATLEHLTGPARGTASWLEGDAQDIFASESRTLRIAPPRQHHSDVNVLARFRRAGDTYEIEACGENIIWVNGNRVSAKVLDSGDLIEFGDTGPLCRFNLHQDGVLLRKTVAEIFNDYMDYARVSRVPLTTRVQRATGNLFGSLTRQTTLMFRSAFVLALVVLSFMTGYQIYSANQLQKHLESDGQRLDAFSSVLTRTREETLHPGDLIELRKEINQNLTSASERLAALEARSGASARVIRSAAASVVFLQGAYGFKEIKTGRMLRHVVDSEGNILMTQKSQPLLTLEGEGIIAERLFTGTAFVISETGLLLTNRHVALPWENDTRITIMEERGMKPVMTRFLGYLPDRVTPFDVTLHKASDEADLAILSCTAVTENIPRLILSESGPALGDEVIVMGYPTGLKSMVAQTGEDFIDDLNKGDGVDFWEVANRLAQNQFIHPLASRGIVARVSTATVVYDAETTHGGSGGPVLDTDGKVVAVNAAIIPDYSGSNIGIPIEHVKKLLKDIETQALQ